MEVELHQWFANSSTQGLTALREEAGMFLDCVFIAY